MKVNVEKIRDKKKSGIIYRVDKLAIHGITPKITIIRVGDDYASGLYVRNKKNMLESIGINVNIVRMDYGISQYELEDVISQINNPMMVQLPLPKHLHEDTIVNSIPPKYDVDCLTNENLGKIINGNLDFLPCTVQACLDIIEDVNGSLDLSAKKVLVIGRSKLVGMPLSVALTHLDATVVTIHSKSHLDKYENKMEGFDIIISATGSHGVVDGSMLEDGQLFIDVGINKDKDGKLCGDMSNPELAKGKYTPVPKGVGIMTVLNVAGNLVKL